MTDSPRYQESVMDWYEANDYAYNELGSPLGDVYEEQIRSMIHTKVMHFIDDNRFSEKSITGREHENGVVIEATLGGKIINPNKIPGVKPRFWLDAKDALVFYFKKESMYYLIRFNI